MFQFCIQVCVLFLISWRVSCLPYMQKNDVPDEIESVREKRHFDDSNEGTSIESRFGGHHHGSIGKIIHSILHPGQIPEHPSLYYDEHFHTGPPGHSRSRPWGHHHHRHNFGHGYPTKHDPHWHKNHPEIPYQHEEWHQNHPEHIHGPHCQHNHGYDGDERWGQHPKNTPSDIPQSKSNDDIKPVSEHNFDIENPSNPNNGVNSSASTTTPYPSIDIRADF